MKETAMFQNNLNLYPNAQLPGSGYSQDIHTRRYNLALSQFRMTLFRGKVSRLRKKVLRRRERLYELDLMKQTLSVRGSCYSGIRVVRIDAIIGSEGRSTDFDIDFHPMGEEARDRWVNMAIVHLTRIPLPPVQLIRIGEAYFVRDGHHRVSVSRAFRQTAMDAEVVTWNASPPFPWQPEAVHCLASAELSV
jgi:hypothetical protein